MQVKLEKKDLYIGRELIVQPKGNAAYHSPEPRKGSITKIGNRYFTVSLSQWQAIRFEIGTGRYAPMPRQDQNSNYLLFDNEYECASHEYADRVRKALAIFWTGVGIWNADDEVAFELYAVLLRYHLVEPVEPEEVKNLTR